MYDAIRTLDYYFFGVGVVSLVSAFFLMGMEFEFYYVFVFFFFTNFFVSLLLNMKILRKLHDIFFLDTKKYILNHIIMAFLSSLIAVVLFVFVKDIFLFISYFLSINFFIMAAALFILIREERLSS